MNSDKIKISLVIPAHNEEKYIGDCLNYAMRFAARDLYEIIVVDNASSDRTREEAEKIKGVKVVYEDRKGLTRARQRGFEEASGDVIAYIDADNRLRKEWIDTVKNEFGRDKKLVCLSGPYVYYDLPRLKKLLVKLYWYLLATPMYFFVGYMAVGGNFAIKKETIREMGGFDTSIEFYGEDTNIARRAHQFGKVKFMPSHFVYSSGRRLSGQGIIQTSYQYMVNFLSEVYFHRPITKKYADYR